VSAETPGAIGQAEAALSGAVGKLFALMEAYPTLKANGNVKALQEELAATENRIAFARQHYNDNATAMNIAVESFPGNLVANWFKFQRKEMLEIPQAETAVSSTRCRNSPATRRRCSRHTPRSKIGSKGCVASAESQPWRIATVLSAAKL
jgi:hypothetical protein